jgi:hypothetical protein
MRDDYITIRISQEEKHEIKEQSGLAGLSISDYIRRRVFGRLVTAKTDLHILAELRRQGGLLKHLYNETKGTYSEALSGAIKANERFYNSLREKTQNKS